MRLSLFGNNVNFLDIIISVILIICFLYGWRRGLLGSLLGLMGIIGSVWLALARGGWLGDLLGEWVDLSPSASAWLGAGLILLVSLLCSFLIITFLDRLIRFAGLGPINAVGGGAVGLINGVIGLGLLFSFLSFHPIFPGLPGYLSSSSLADPVEGASRRLVAGIRHFSPNVEDLLERMREDRGSVIHRDPVVLEEVSRRVEKILTEMDSLVKEKKANSAPE